VLFAERALYNVAMVSARLALALSAAFVAGCGGSDPEAAIRERLAAATQAAEARDTGFFRDFLAASYRDTRGNDRDGAIGTIRGYFIAHSGIEIVSRVEDVTLTTAEAARAVVHAGLLGQRAGEPLLGGVEGELYRIELELVEDAGSWRVTGATWDRPLGD
jgi:hypothetical protein